MAKRMPWPASLNGARCLDVGTMDGFWAFEMERRGAAEIIGIDLNQHSEPANNFRLAADLLGSSATWQEVNVYDLSPTKLGQFDLVFVGYVLNLLQDPVRALEAIRNVCRGAVIVLDEISLPLTMIHRQPLAKLVPRPGYLEWWVFNAAGLRRVLTVAGFQPEAESSLLRFQPGPGTDLSTVPMAYRLRRAAGLAGVSLAVRARPS
jgi:tRNA (mo5U34)-methyltransferase